MQFKVPQNVQREDTIVGPLTLKQLAIVGIGGSIAYSLYVSLAQTYYVEVWLPPVLLVSAITLAFAFLQIHSLPFHLFLMNLIEYKLLEKKRIWHKGDDTIHIFRNEEIKTQKNQISAIPVKEFKKIDEISKILDSYSQKIDQLKEEKITK